MLVNVLFPLKLPALTYRVPDGATLPLRGRIVLAPLSGVIRPGLIVDESVGDIPAHHLSGKHKTISISSIRDIQSIGPSVATDSYLSFLSWLSDYYLTPPGIALKSCFFREIVDAANAIEKTGGKGSDLPEAAVSRHSAPIPGPPDEWPQELFVCLRERRYATFLHHASSREREYDLVSSTARHASTVRGGVLVLVPEIGEIGAFATRIQSAGSARVCILHSRLGKKARLKAIRDILTGDADIVVGTRSAILAPFRHLSLIIVTGEHSTSYKGEEGLRYQGRDVAVRRGFMEEVPVLLTSVCPSLESVYNASVSKYILPDVPERQGHDVPGAGTQESPVTVGRERPHIRIIRRKPLLTDKLPLSQEIVSAVRKYLGKGERVLFLINRKGYSAVRCDDCDHMLRCISCDVPLVLYRGRGAVRCPSCKQERPIAEICPHCGGYSLRPFGLGTERLREQVERAFSTGALLVEKDGVKIREVDRGSPDVLHLVVGTTFARRKTIGESFSAAVLLNIDSLLSRPHFRAFERAFQEIVEVAQSLRPDGTLYVETADPANAVLRAAAKYNFPSFYRFELSQRRSTGYPPFSKLIMLTLAVTDGGEKIAGQIRSMLESVKHEGVDILGPIDLPPSPKKQDHRKLQVLLKSKDRRQVHDTARAFLKKIERMKDMAATVDVDPSEI